MAVSRVSTHPGDGGKTMHDGEDDNDVTFMNENQMNMRQGLEMRGRSDEDRAC